jgi:hypothetical protein
MTEGVNGTLNRSRIRLQLELVRAEPLIRHALPALEAAKERGEGELLVRAAREALPRLEAPADMLVRGRLESVVATAPEVPRTEHALEEIAWALLRAARVAPPVSLDEDWDLLRALLDPARRRGRGIGAFASNLAASALVGEGPLATRGGFALARNRSYATGWNDAARTRRIARALALWTPARLAQAATLVPREIAREIYPLSRTPLSRRLARARRALALLQHAYSTAARERAGVFLELEIG